MTNLIDEIKSRLCSGSGLGCDKEASAEAIFMLFFSAPAQQMTIGRYRNLIAWLSPELEPQESLPNYATIASALVEYFSNLGRVEGQISRLKEALKNAEEGKTMVIAHQDIRDVIEAVESCRVKEQG